MNEKNMQGCGSVALDVITVTELLEEWARLWPTYALETLKACGCSWTWLVQ